MKGILINPLTKEITELETDGSLKSLCEILQCNTIDAVEMDNGDTIWVDDEGWVDYKERGGVCYPSVVNRHFFELGGPVFILGTDHSNGTSKDPISTVESVRKSFIFIPEVRLNELIHFYA